jgi:arylsulfatase A-like enzyme
VGLALAGREIVQHGYVPAGLWRTSLWVGYRAALTGAAVGVAGGMAMLSLLYLWRAALSRQGRGDSALQGARLSDVVSRLVLFLGLLTGAAVLAIPHRAVVIFGIPYAYVALLAFGLVWVVAAGLSVRMIAGLWAPADPHPWFRLRWMMTVALGCVVALLHLWIRLGRFDLRAGVAAGAVVVLVAAYYGLLPAARLLHDRLGRPTGRVVSGRLGGVLSVVALMGTLLLLAAGWASHRQARVEAKARRRNVILIGIDTLRSDRASLISEDEYARDLTPNLREGLVARGTVFSNAISQAPWTLPAFASILTGLYPKEHGAERILAMLPPGQLTVAELLREAGYRTLAVVSGTYVSRAAGMDQGFDLFDESQVLGPRAVTSEEVTTRAIRLLEANREEPFFLFVHYFDPHWTYHDHDGYHFADGYDGPLREPARELDQEEFKSLVGALRPRRCVLPTEDHAFLCDLYDEEIAYTDAEIGRLLDFLEEGDLWESTLVIVVSDHGEEFLEHGKLGHAHSLFQELVHVPLALVAPVGDHPGIVTRPVETRAVFSTITEFAGITPPRGRTYPPSLLASDPAQPALARSANYVLTTGMGGHLFAVPKEQWVTSVTGAQWKLIKFHLAERMVFFDLLNDPGETRNCAADNPKHRAELERALNRMDAAVSAGAPREPIPEADEEQRRRLKSLGYL